jgi:hypothetical protein
MNYPRTCRSLASPAASLLVAASLVGAIHANAAHISTTAELRQAIETSPGNVLVLDHSVKISSGLTSPPGTEMIATGGTIVLAQGASLELEAVSLNFAGPLVVRGESGQKAEIKLSRSQLNAHAITFDLPGAGSSIGSSLTSLRASIGDLVIAYGDEGKLEFKERLLPGPSYGLSAAGMVEISGGRKLNVMLDETVIDTVSGFLFQANLFGSDLSLKVQKVIFYASEGSVSIGGAILSSKASVEILESSFWVRDHTTMRFDDEASINLKQTSFGPYPGVATAAGVTIETDILGTINASEITTFDVVNVAFRTSHRGVLLVDKSRLFSDGDLVLQTGNQGITTVKENTLAAGTRVRIASSTFGYCNAENNSISAPIQELCP